jgi:hypothetical protein
MNVIRLSQIIPKRTPLQLTQALKASSWYPSTTVLHQWPMAGMYKSESNKWETGIKDALRSTELWVQLRMKDGDDQSREDFLAMADLLGQEEIQAKFLVGSCDAWKCGTHAF